MPDAWDDTAIGDGPLALGLAPLEGSGENDPRLIAVSTARPTGVIVLAGQLAAFLARHPAQSIVCVDVPHLLAALRPAAETFEDLAEAWRDIARNGKLTDIRCLDWQIRRSRSTAANEKLLAWPELAEQQLKSNNPEPREPRDTQEPPDAAYAVIDQMRLVLDCFSAMAPDLQKLVDESKPIDAPFMVAEFSPEIAQLRNQEIEQWCAEIMSSKSESPPEEPPEPRQRRRRPPKGAVVDETLEAQQIVGLPDHEEFGPTTADAPPPKYYRVGQPHTDDRSATTGLLGHHVEAWAELLFGDDRRPALTIDKSRMAELLLRAQERYRGASDMLAKAPVGNGHGQTDSQVAAAKGFAWDSAAHKIALNKNGFPETQSDTLGNWLTELASPLCDILNEPATIPRSRNGDLSRNPEHWGIWASCDQQLWAWREVFRMAEVARLADAGSLVSPRYETWPRLRAIEPNLAVYRSLNVPVFRPGPGMVFVVLRLAELRTRCMAALAIRDRQISLMAGQLSNYLLKQNDPIELIASRLRELYHGNESASAESGWEADDVRRRWSKLTEALLETIPLGVAEPLLERILANDYGLKKLGETRVATLRDLLAGKIAHELGVFMEDFTLEVVTAHLGISHNESIQRFTLSNHPETSPAWLRRKSAHSSVHRLLGQDAPMPPTAHGKNLFRYRGTSLAWRPTQHAASAAVRRQQLLLSEDEAMLAAALELAGSGYRVLGIAGHELLVEVREIEAKQEQFGRLREIVYRGVSRLLGPVALRVQARVADEW